MEQSSECWMVLKKVRLILYQSLMTVNTLSQVIFFHFVTQKAGEDKLVRLWGYDDGSCYYKGVGHAGTINRVFFCL